MPRSVFANGRNFSHKGSGDQSICTAPDVCKTPVGSVTVPIPYPVVSQASQLADGTTSVKIDGNSTAIESSNHSMCSGDEAGVAKGLLSSTTSSKTHFVTYSFDVKADGKGVVRHMDITTMNNRNTIGINMGSMGMGATASEQEGKFEDIYTLRFEFVDELGQPVKGIPYKTLPAGQKNDWHIADNKTNGFGKTNVASTKQGESVDCFIAWSKHE